RALRMPTVLVVTVALLVVGVARWPRDSTDIWSYAAYGRMVSVYGASPYRPVPVELSNDRASRRAKPPRPNTSSVPCPMPDRVAVAISLGALVKLVALLGLVALIVWILRKRGVRPAAIATGVGGGVLAVGYALSGGLAALTPLRDARLQMSRNSIWLLSNSEG